MTTQSTLPDETLAPADDAVVTVHYPRTTVALGHFAASCAAGRRVPLVAAVARVLDLARATGQRGTPTR